MDLIRGLWEWHQGSSFSCLMPVEKNWILNKSGMALSSFRRLSGLVQSLPGCMGIDQGSWRMDPSKTFSQIMTWIWDSIKTAAKTSMDLVGQLPTFAWNTVKSLGNWVANTFGQIMTWIWNEPDCIHCSVNGVWTVAGQHLDTSQAVWVWLVARGYGISYLVWNGIKTVFTAVF